MRSTVCVCVKYSLKFVLYHTHPYLSLDGRNISLHNYMGTYEKKTHATAARSTQKLFSFVYSVHMRKAHTRYDAHNNESFYVCVCEEKKTICLHFD